MNRLLAVHLFNDYSGSPRVLADQVNYWQAAGWSATLLTSNTEGALSQLKNVDLQTFNYQFSAHKLVRLWRFLLAQCAIILAVFKARREIDVVYINTLLPFGAAIMAKVLGIKVVYHLHETSLRPYYFKWVLRQVATACADASVYVSNFLQKTEKLPGVPGHVIYNTLPTVFLKEARTQRELCNQRPATFTCLMACSLKQYKGVDQYIALAERLPNYQFQLVLNADDVAIKQYFQEQQLPDNLIIFPAQSNMHWFYQRTDLVLNLSLPDQWVETFGLTLLEAFAYGKPVIGPAVGGPTEVISHRKNGFSISAYALDNIATEVEHLANDTELYQQFSQCALATLAQFDRQSIQPQVNRLLDSVLYSPTITVAGC